MNVLSHLLRSSRARTADGKLTAGDAYKADPYLTDANKTVWRLFQSVDGPGAHHRGEEVVRRGRAALPERTTGSSSAGSGCSCSRTSSPRRPPTRSGRRTTRFIAADKVDKPEFAKRKGMMLAAIGLDPGRAAGQRAVGDQPRPGQREHRPDGDLA